MQEDSYMGVPCKKISPKNLVLLKMLEIEPTNTCNLRCKMCHISYIDIYKGECLEPK